MLTPREKREMDSLQKKIDKALRGSRAARKAIAERKFSPAHKARVERERRNILNKVKGKRVEGATESERAKERNAATARAVLGYVMLDGEVLEPIVRVEETEKGVIKVLEELRPTPLMRRR